MPAANPDRELVLTNISVYKLEPKAKPYEMRDTKMKGLLLRVQPSGTKAYYVTYRRKDGRRTRYRLGDTQHLTPAQAREQAKIQLGKVAGGNDPQVEKAEARREANKVTLRKFIDEKYLPWAQANLKSWKSSVDRIGLFESFMDKQLESLTAWQFEKWITAKKKIAQPRTINRDIAGMRACLNKAVQWGDLEVNPLSQVKALKVDSAPIVRYLTETEEAQLRAALEECPEPYLKPMVILSINTGMRRGEVFNLKWEDVSFSQKSIVIHGAGAKSGQTRHIPLNTEAVHVLKVWQTTDTGLVFPGKYGTPFNNTKRSWSALLKRASITNFRWHDMRHHFASKLVMAGVDLNTVRELLGHSDITMTLRYAHLAPEHKAAAVELVSGAQS